MITSAWLENLLIFYYVDELYKEKFVSHQFVNALYASLESRIVNTKGSHDTWEFIKDGHKVKTVFFTDHGRDKYGDWARLKVARVVKEVLSPFCRVE